MEQTRKGWLRIVNWRPLQKYQKPNPPWIKLYTSLFNDDGPESKWNARQRWESLGAGGQSLLLNLWLFVATGTTDGRFWSDPEFLRGILPTDAPIELGPLLAGGFIEWCPEGKGPEGKDLIDRIDPVDGKDAKEIAKAEGEGEGETEREAEQSPSPPQAADTEKERESQSGSAPRTAKQKPEAKPEKRAQPAERQVTARSQTPAKGPEPAKPVAVIGNPAPPGGIRLNPPESDGGGRPALRPDSRAKGPPARGGDPSLLGKSLPMALRQAGDPVKYGWLADLYQRLGFAYPMDSPLGRQELGSFESLYEELMGSRLSHAARMEVLARDLEDADNIVRKKKARKRGAVFCAIHNSRLATYLARAGPGR